MTKCNEKCIVYKRVVGYYSPTMCWNPGKVEEGKMRKMFKINEYLEEKKESKEELSALTV